MPHPVGSDQVDSYSLLEILLDPSLSTPAPRRLPPTAGTLPGFSRSLGGHRSAMQLAMVLRSLGQVIFINNPISGLLLVLALLLQSTAMGLFAIVGIAAANLTARCIGAERSARHNGIYGFNGALVGSALAASARLDIHASLPAWILVVIVGATLTTLLVEFLGRWMVRRLGLPPLTLPFCLATWLLLAVVMTWHPGGLALAEPVSVTVWPQAVPNLLVGVVRGFGQVFVCSSLTTGLVVLSAVAAASPLGALIGLAGGLVSSLTALAMGMDQEAVGLGLGSYNGILTAIAIAGTFYAPTLVSAAIALLAAAGTSLMTPALAALMVRSNLPLLTLPFILATMVTMLAVRRSLPSLLPVALHSLVTPEEHRHRYMVARSLLREFRLHLRRTIVSAVPQTPLLDQARPELVRRLDALFSDLDRDGDGQLDVAELSGGLVQRQPDAKADLSSERRSEQLRIVLERMDLDGDGHIDRREFAELILRLRRLQEGQERLLTYMAPVDADGDDQLDPAELNRLFASVGQPPLTEQERLRLFGAEGFPLSWGGFVDQLLLT